MIFQDNIFFAQLKFFLIGTVRTTSRHVVTRRDTRSRRKQELGRYQRLIDWRVVELVDGWKTNYPCFLILLKLAWTPSCHSNR